MSRNLKLVPRLLDDSSDLTPTLSSNFSSNLSSNFFGAALTQVLMVACMLATPAAANADQASQTFTPSPILIEADHFEVRFAEDVAQWSGNVTATQGNYTFRSGNLTIHLDQVSDGADHTTTASSKGEALPDRFYLSAESLTYDLADSAITGSGDSELRRGQELIKADTIVYWVDRRTAIAQPADNGRVTVQFFPNPKKPIFPNSLANAPVEKTQSTNRLAQLEVGAGL